MLTVIPNNPLDVHEGPIDIRNSKGDQVATILGEYMQADGIPRSMNIAGTPYETLAFVYNAPSIEACEDIGAAQVVEQFKAVMIAIVEDPDFWSIEWRVRPALEYFETKDTTATIIDKVTGQPREGVEVQNGVQVRCRLVVHKRSARPATGIAGKREGEAA